MPDIRLKSRRECPPNGFQYRQKESGWYLQLWDFEALCKELLKHRQANPRFKLSLDINAIRDEVDQVNALRVATIPNSESYIRQGSPPPKSLAPASQSKLAAVAGAVRKVSSGSAVLLDWEMSNDPPVDANRSAMRAAVCVACPKNGKGDFTRWFTVPASEIIRKRIQRLSAFNLSTPSDAQLGVCEACLCPLKLKVHTPLQHILKHLRAEDRAELHPQCWVLAETPVPVQRRD